MESILSITGKLVYLAVFVGGIVFLLNLFFPDLLQKTEKEEVEKDLPVDVPEQTETVEKHEERQEISPTPLIVRHLSDKATLLVRYRARKKASTAHLIVWSGAKRKGISDSYYDLGLAQDREPDDEVIDEFIALAKERINELAQQGKRKRKATSAATAEPQVVVVEAVLQDEPVVPAPVVHDVEDTPPESIRLRKFPSVYRGIITEVGMMQQSKNGNEFTTFGVRYRTPEGIEDAVFGANLRVALKEARADIGDAVEILKIGRKTVDPQKAPMNLFKVAKLPAL